MPKFHLIIWTAMLLGVGLETTKVNLVHGFINDKNGRKMSKSMGNGISPLELVEKFGVEGTRFIMAQEINTYDDTNFDIDKVTASYNANLANNLGNLVMRVSNLSEKLLGGIIPEPQLEQLENFQIPTSDGGTKEFDLSFGEVLQNLENYQPQKAIQALFNQISLLNEYLEQTKPWSLAKDLDKNRAEIEKILGLSAFALRKTGEILSIFMPQTGARIYEIFAAEIITKSEILFARIED
jgi:methionyl-tRNA synthetase